MQKKRRWWALLAPVSSIGLCACGLVDSSGDEARQQPEKPAESIESGGAGGRPGKASTAAAGAGGALFSEDRKETCNGSDDDGDGKVDEGCPMLLGECSTFALDGGRVVWLGMGDSEDPGLWTARLPQPVPEKVSDGSKIRFDVDEDRIVYSQAEPKGYVLVDWEEGSQELIPPHDEEGYTLKTPSLDGDYLAYSQELPITCGGWCDEEEVFLHDLAEGVSTVIAPDAGTIQASPVVSGQRLAWIDDRHGHHLDGGSHWFDVFAASLPYNGQQRRLTEAPPASMDVIAFVDPLVLMHHVPTPGLHAYQVLNAQTEEHVSIDWAVAQGETPLDLSSEFLLVRKDPLGSCHLSLAHLRSESLLDLNTDGMCPTEARIDGDFLVWIEVVGKTNQLYWMDIGDLLAGD